MPALVNQPLFSFAALLLTADSHSALDRPAVRPAFQGRCGELTSSTSAADATPCRSRAPATTLEAGTPREASSTAMVTALLR